MTDLPPRVRLESVLRWYCPTCHHINFHNGVPIRDDEIRGDVKELRGMMASEAPSFDPAPAEDFFMAPTVVFCARCEGRFEVAQPDDGC